MIETFGVNSFLCTSCSNEMMIWEIWHRKYGLIYNIFDKSNYKNIINEIDEFKPIRIVDTNKSERICLF